MTRFRLLGLIAGLAALVGAGLLGLAMIGDDGSETRADEPGGRYGRAYAGLCLTRSAARSGDVDAARDAFFDQVHQPLHELAAETGARDRAASARLLEAKEAVEAALNQASATLASELDRLLATAGAAMGAVGYAHPPPCQGRT